MFVVLEEGKKHMVAVWNCMFCKTKIKTQDKYDSIGSRELWSINGEINGDQIFCQTFGNTYNGDKI